MGARLRSGSTMQAIRCRRWLISAMPTEARARRILQRPKIPDRERLGDDNREKGFGSKRRGPVSTVVDLCDADGSQGSHNPPETGGTRRGRLEGGNRWMCSGRREVIQCRRWLISAIPTGNRVRRILQSPAVPVGEQSEGGDCLEIIGANRSVFWGFSAKFINVELSKRMLSKIHLPIYQKIHLFRDILALPNASSRGCRQR
jgi:hypothetical protein